MCQPNANHMHAFKNAQVIEVPPTTFTIKGRANSKTILLHFKPNVTFCEGTTTTSQVVCYFEPAGWAEAKAKAQANVEYFHVHGTVAGAGINQAALSYSNSGGGGV